MPSKKEPFLYNGKCTDFTFTFTYTKIFYSLTVECYQGLSALSLCFCAQCCSGLRTCHTSTPMAYLIRVALPVKGPNRMSPNGGWKPRMARASSCVRGGRLMRWRGWTNKLYEDKLPIKNSHKYFMLMAYAGNGNWGLKQ